jgi:hypothetical protein
MKAGTRLLASLSSCAVATTWPARPPQGWNDSSVHIADPSIQSEPVPALRCRT